MEPLTMVTPLDQDFSLEVPSRNAHWYAVEGYEPLSANVFGAACRDADVVIDIGAHVGFYSLLASARNRDCRVIAVEASPENAEATARNAAHAGATNVEVRNAAFHSEEGTISFEVTQASDNCGLSGHPDAVTTDVIEVDSITGSSLMVESGQRVIVKLDVEGHELAALHGLQQVLNEAKSLHLLVEFNPRCIRAAGNDPEDLVRWLRGNGYRLYVMHESEYRWQEWTEEASAPSGVVDDWYLNLWCVKSKPAQSLCAVLHSSGMSGAERSHLEMVEDLVADGRMFHTVIPEPDRGLSALLRKAGSTVSLVPSYLWWAIPQAGASAPTANDWVSDLIAPQVVGAVSSVDPDLILTQSVVIPQGATTAAILGVPHVWYLREFADLDHDLRLPDTPAVVGGLVRGLSTAVVCNSAAVRDHFFPEEPAAARVLSPVPRRSFEALMPCARVSEGFTVGVVGSLQPGKGQTDALEAAALLIAEKDIPAHVVLVGAGSIEDTERLRRHARSLGVEDQLTFTGELGPTQDIYSMMDVVAVTSRSEAFGRVPLEATQAGVPVVYAARGGITEYMVDGETGLAYSPGNPGELAEALARLATSTTLGSDLVAGARTMAAELRRKGGGPAGLREVLDEATRTGASGVMPVQIVRWLFQGIGQSWYERDEAYGRRDEAERQLAQTCLQYDAVAANLDEVSRRLDAVTAEREAALADLETALETLDMIRSSRSWRLTAHLRQLKRSVRPQEEAGPTGGIAT